MTAPSNRDLKSIEEEHDRLHKQVVIDKHALDDELSTQAVKYRDVCDALTSTISYMAAAKDAFARIEAELDQEIRDDHEKSYPEGKAPRITDLAVRAKMALDERWQEAKARRREWENAHTKMQHLKEVFGQRSSNMKELPVLFAAGYWQGNSSTGRPRGEVDAERTRRQLDERRGAATTEASPTGRRRPRD